MRNESCVQREIVKNHFEKDLGSFQNTLTIRFTSAKWFPAFVWFNLAVWKIWTILDLSKGLFSMCRLRCCEQLLLHQIGTSSTYNPFFLHFQSTQPTYNLRCYESKKSCYCLDRSSVSWQVESPLCVHISDQITPFSLNHCFHRNNWEQLGCYLEKRPKRTMKMICRRISAGMWMDMPQGFLVCSICPIFPSPILAQLF